MTTLVATADGIWSDSQATSDIMFQVTKVFKVGRTVFGLCGTYSKCMRVLEWIRDPDCELPDDFAWDDVGILAVDKTGIRMYEDDFPFYVRSPYVCIGSGAKSAQATLWALQEAGLGVDPGLAIRAASTVDPFTDDTVQCELWRKAGKK